jgi:hypothetical protein
LEGSATCKGYGNSQPLKLWDMAYYRIISCSTVKTMHDDDDFHAPSTNADFAAFAIPTGE